MGYQATNAYPALTDRDGYMGHKKLYTSHISYVLSTANFIDWIASLVYNQIYEADKTKHISA